MTQDGLYINDTWVSPFEKFALNLQANDLTKPDTQQSSYTTSIDLPDTLAAWTVTEGAESPSSGSDVPYRHEPAYVVMQGERVLSGRFEFTSFQRGWKGNLMEGKQGVLTGLKRPLRSLNMGAYNFTWNVAAINSRQQATEGVCFPLIDYGTLSTTEQPSDVLNPAMFVHTLIDTMLYESGYRLVGSMLDDPLYKRLVLPFTEEKATNADADFIEARRARVATPTGQIGHKNSRNAPRNITLPLTTVDRPLEGFGQGRLNNYNPARTAYVCDTAMRMTVTAYQQFFVYIGTGAVEAKLQVEKNGVVVAEEVWEKAGPGYNALLSKTETLEIKTTVDCQKGDTLRIRFIIRNRTKIATYSNAIYFGPQQSFAGFEPDTTLLFGDRWPVARNLPDMDCLTLLRAISLMTSSTIDVNENRRQIRFIRLSDVANNIGNALEWSDRISGHVAPQITPKLEPYTQNNFLRYAESADVEKEYADGRIEAKSPDASKVDLFTLPFAASMQSNVEISGYGKPLSIATRTVSSKGEVSRKSTAPRLILVEPSQSVPLNTSVLNGTGNVEKQTVSLMPCFFDNRPNMAATLDNNLSLNFNDTSRSTGLISRYFVGLRRVLRRPRVVEVAARLLPSDVAGLDFSRPVRLHSLRVDTLDFGECWYYLNRISSYNEQGICLLTLVNFS